MALDDYFANPSQDCLARLFDAVNSMDISMAPSLSRYEKLIMRTSERKDVFLEKFDDFIHDALGEREPTTAQPLPLGTRNGQGHQTSASSGSQSSLDDSLQPRGRDENGKKYSPTEASFSSLDGSAVWVGNESGLDQVVAGAAGGLQNGVTYRGRASTDASSSSHGRREDPIPTHTAASVAMSLLKDSHFFPATVEFNDHRLPVKVPLSTFPEEVGDVRVLTMSASTQFLTLLSRSIP